MTGIKDRPFAAASAFRIDEARGEAQFSSRTDLSSIETKELRTAPTSMLNCLSSGRVNCGEKFENSNSFVFGDIDAEKNLHFLLFRVVPGTIMGTLVFIGLFYLAAAPPMHWFYEVGNAAGPASVYLPGGGFSGFWFHLGYLHSFRNQHNLHDYDYYCFSAGCLNILSVFLNRSLEEVYDTALASQNAWKSGNRSRFEIVEYFFDELLPPATEDNCIEAVEEQLSFTDDHGNLNFLPRMKILVTTPFGDGYVVLEPTNRNELKEYILRTTWVPYLTGWGWLMPTTQPDADGHQELYLDGGCSRHLHPRCEAEWHLPLMWETLVHTFSPGLSREQVQSLWERGNNYEYQVPASTRTTTRNVTANIAMRVPHSSGVINNTVTSSDPLSCDELVNGNGHCSAN